MKEGDVVIVDGYMAKDGSKLANARNVKLADGRKPVCRFHRRRRPHEVSQSCYRARRRQGVGSAISVP